MDTIPNIQPYTIEQYNEPDPNSNNVNQDINSELNQNNYGSYNQPQKTSRRFPLPLILGGIAVLGLLIFGFLLLASGGGEESGDNNNNQTAENVTLQWWGVFLDSEVVQPLIDEYQEQNPNVTIQYANKWPGGERNASTVSYQEELNRVLLNNDPVELPDIFMVENTWIGDYEPFARSSSSFDINEYSTIFHSAVVSDFASTGSIYGTPMWMDNLSIVYNRDLLSSINLESPPDSWIRFKNASEALTVLNSNNIEQAGFAAGTSENVSFAFELTNLLIAQNGVEFTSSDGLPIFASDASTDEAFAFYNSFSEGSDKTWDETLKNDAAAFLEGDLAMTAATSWRLRDILRFNEDLGAGIDIGVATIPQVEGQPLENMNWATYWGNMVSLNRPYGIESWEFLKWLSEPAQQETLSSNIEQAYGYFGTIYPRRDMQSNLSEDQYLSVYSETLENSQTWSMVNGRYVKNLFLEYIDAGSGNIESLQDDIAEIIALRGSLTREE